MKAKLLILILFPVFLFGKENVKPAIVFDYGGVLATEHKEEYHAFIAKHFSIPLTEAPLLLKQVRKWRKKTQDDARAWELVAKERGVTLPAEWLRQCEEKMLDSIHERPHMMELVRTLKNSGYRVAMLSNISRRAACLVRKLGYYDPFDPVLLSCEIGVSKPKIHSFRILLNRLKRPGNQVIFIDDQEQNIQAATSLHIDAILFTSYPQLLTSLQHRGILPPKE